MYVSEKTKYYVKKNSLKVLVLIELLNTESNKIKKYASKTPRKAKGINEKRKNRQNKQMIYINHKNGMAVIFRFVLNKLKEHIKNEKLPTTYKNYNIKLCKAK